MGGRPLEDSPREPGKEGLHNHCSHAEQRGCHCGAREIVGYTTSSQDISFNRILTDFLSKPTHVLNAAGSTGRPNVDWCEDHREDTIRNNVVGTINLADCCWERGIHITVFATGCIYAYDEKHPMGGPGFLETDKANFDGSFYSETKAHVEEVSKITTGSYTQLTQTRS